MFKDGLLKGKRILVTGGGTGLGKEMATHYASLGADIVICGRRLNVLEETADEIKSNLEKGIAVLRNGDKTPKWVKVDIDKGELILNPTKKFKHLNLSIISIDADGNKIKNDIKGKINKRSAERFAKQIEIKEQTKFVSLTEQVGVEANIQDDYGSDIINRL